MSRHDPVGPGRPTRAQQKARQEALLEVALDHFLNKGFEQATIEAIAKEVSMTKRTVYARYSDKAALFRAAVNRAIEKYSLSAEEIAAADRGELEETLVAVAWLRVSLVTTPNGIKLQRIINAESYRFPQLLTDAYEQSVRPVAEYLAALFRRETSAGRLAIEFPMETANVFLSMVLGGLVRPIVLGSPPSRDEIDRRIRASISLFLDGARPR